MELHFEMVLHLKMVLHPCHGISLLRTVTPFLDLLTYTHLDCLGLTQNLPIFYPRVIFTLGLSQVLYTDCITSISWHHVVDTEGFSVPGTTQEEKMNR